MLFHVWYHHIDISEKLPLNSEYDFEINRQEDNVFFKFGNTKITYDFNEPGHSLAFKLDGVKLGTLDISKFALSR